MTKIRQIITINKNFIQLKKKADYKEKSNKMQQRIQIFIVLYLYEAQHVSGETSPIIRGLKLHWQPPVFSYVEGCQACSWWTLSGT